MSDENQSTPEPTDPKPLVQAPIIARYGKYYRNTRYLMFVLFMGFALLDSTTYQPTVDQSTARGMQ